MGWFVGGFVFYKPPLRGTMAFLCVLYRTLLGHRAWLKFNDDMKKMMKLFEYVTVKGSQPILQREDLNNKMHLVPEEEL